MPTASDFLRAIEADFDSDVPRLVYADWLDENGEADRAEFIRVQCEAAEVGDRPALMPAADRSRYEQLSMRAAALLARHRRDWATGLPAWASRPKYHRGFVQLEQLTGRQLAFDGAQVRATTPLGGRVRLNDVDWQPTAVFNSEHLEAVTAIALEDSPRALTDPVVRALAGGRHLGRVRRLRVGAGQYIRGRDFPGLTDSAATALGESSRLSALTELHLIGWPRLSADGVGTILGGTFADRLTVLNLTGRGGHPDLSDAFRRTKSTRLQVLTLAMRPIGDIGAAVLADSPALVRLTELNLSATDISDAGALNLIRSPHLLGLRRLDLSVNPGVTDATARSILADSRSWEWVRLQHCRVSDGMIAAVARRCQGSP